MNEAVVHEAQLEAVRRGLARDRVGWLTGLAGLGFVLFVVIQNIAHLNAPQADASVAEVSEFYMDNETPVALTLALVALNIPLLLVFASGFTARVQRLAGGEMPIAGRAGFAGAIGVVGLFSVVSITRAALVNGAEGLAGEPALTQMVWDFQTGAFAFAQVVLAVVLGAFAWAGRDVRLTPAWLAYLALAGSAALVVSGAAVVPTMDGSPIALLGLVGFLIWLFWLAFTSVSLMRAASSTAS